MPTRLRQEWNNYEARKSHKSRLEPEQHLPPSICYYDASKKRTNGWGNESPQEKPAQDLAPFGVFVHVGDTGRSDDLECDTKEGRESAEHKKCGEVR